MIKPKVKICCISSVQEADLAIKYGADALGLVSEMPSGPGVIPETLITQIADYVPPLVSTVLLTCKQNSGEIIEQHKICKTNTIQIVDRLLEGTHQDIKNNIPGIKIVQVVHVQNEYSIEEALDISQHVDAILLDSGNQKLQTKILGGTGKTHNWNISKKICECVNVPIFLAGGLNPDNILEAIQTVKPYAVDLCNGVRTNMKLDENKLSHFFEIVNSI